jgi:hypothetical protein
LFAFIHGQYATGTGSCFTGVDSSSKLGDRILVNFLHKILPLLSPVKFILVGLTAVGNVGEMMCRDSFVWLVSGLLWSVGSGVFVVCDNTLNFGL